MSVVDDILQLNEVKKIDKETVLRNIADSISRNNKFSLTTSEILDLIFAATGYQNAQIPGGESFVCSKVINVLMSYMTLRAQQQTGKEKNANKQQIENLRELINSSASLYSEVNANLPSEV